MRIQNKLIIPVLILCNLVSNAQQPILNWAKSIGSLGTDEGRGISVDASGNVFVCGSFSGTVDFDPGPGSFVLSAGGSRDAFISKFDPVGNFLWTKQIQGAASTTNVATGLCLDNTGNIYTTGIFGGTADFDPSALAYNITSLSSSNVFVQKLDASGNFVWAVAFFGNGLSGSTDIAVDKSNNIYTTGYFSESVDFDPAGPFSYSLTASPTATNMFICKLSSNAAFLWAVKMGGYNVDRSTSITIDENKNVLTAGYTYSTSNLGNGFYGGAGFDDIFICKRDSLGQFKWARRLGTSGNDQGQSVAVDQWGNSYLTGSFTGTLTYSGGSITSSGADDIFICKYNLAGDVIWIKNIGGTFNDIGYGLTVDASGNPIISGVFQGTVDFDPSPSVATATSIGGLYDLFIAKYDSACSFQWLGTMSAAGSELPRKIVSFGQNVYLTGLFYNTMDFDPGPNTTTLVSNGNADAFVAKYSSPVIGIKENNSDFSVVSVFPSPFEEEFNIEFKDKMNLQHINYTIYNSLSSKVAAGAGRIVDNKIIIRKYLPPGIYFLHIKTANQFETIQKIISK